MERPDTVTPAFYKSAHDEYLELWMECGWAAPALICAFLAWWSAAALAPLRRPPSEMAALQTAGAVIVAMLLLHSLVDYPLRTPALATIFGFACALTVRPPPTGPTYQGSLRPRRLRQQPGTDVGRRAKADAD